jgi:hypothetical protein
MTKADTAATFFMKIPEIGDQLDAIGETISDRELVLTTLNALPKHWEPFLQSISSRAELPTFESNYLGIRKRQYLLPLQQFRG